MDLNNKLAAAICAALATSGLLAAAPASALPVQAQGRAAMQMLDIKIYNIDQGPDSGGDFRFYDDQRQLRGLTTIDFDNRTNPSGTNVRQVLDYTQLPILPAVSDSRSDPASDQFAFTQGGSLDDEGAFDGGLVDGGCTVFALDATCQGGAGVSTTATGTVEPGFYNLILGPRTAVEMSAASFVEVWLRETCLLNCGTIFAQAELLAQFAPEDLQNPGLPDFNQAVTRRSRNTLFYDASSFGDTGNLFYDSRGQELRLLFENTLDVEVFGRVRWLTQVNGESAVPAPVPEPGSLALLGMGLGLLGVSRRRSRG